jgi:hypothetical protein
MMQGVIPTQVIRCAAFQGKQSDTSNHCIKKHLLFVLTFPTIDIRVKLSLTALIAVCIIFIGQKISNEKDAKKVSFIYHDSNRQLFIFFFNIRTKKFATVTTAIR